MQLNLHKRKFVLHWIRLIKIKNNKKIAPPPPPPYFFHYIQLFCKSNQIKIVKPASSIELNQDWTLNAPLSQFTSVNTFPSWHECLRNSASVSPVVPLNTRLSSNVEQTISTQMSSQVLWSQRHSKKTLLSEESSTGSQSTVWHCKGLFKGKSQLPVCLLLQNDF